MDVELTDFEASFENRLRTTLTPSAPRPDLWDFVSATLTQHADPAELELESELRKLEPAAMGDAQKARLLSAIQLEISPEDEVVALLNSLTPAKPRKDLWSRIEAELHSEAPHSPKILEFPPTRELAPLFKVAAIMVLFLGLLALWYEPIPSTSPTSVADVPSTQTTPLEPRPLSYGSSPISPVSQGTVYRNDQPYRSVRMRMTDTYFYKGANGEILEIKVPREEELILPLRTF